MTWPLSQDYNEAVQDPALSFADPELRQGQAATNALGMPMPCSGNFADVYEFYCPATKNKWAVKCFTRQVPGQRQRYTEISRALPAANLPFAVEFQYLPQGIKFRGDWFPVVKMRWIEGLPLNEFVRANVDKPAMLSKLGVIWARMAKRLREAGIAHCDLQHGNVLLVPGATSASLALKLIDYDGMYVPALAGTKSGEVGHPNYQHPQRLREGTYNVEVDRFPLLVVATALQALTVGGPSLWASYDNGDNLLFKESDMRAPAQSALFRELLGINEPLTRTLVGALLRAVNSKLEETPHVDELMPGPKPAAERPPAVATKPAVAVSSPNITVPAKSELDFTDASAGGPRREPAQRGGLSKWVWLAGAAGAAVLAVVVTLAMGGGSKPKTPDDAPIAAKKPGDEEKPKDSDKIPPKETEPKKEPANDPPKPPIKDPKPHFLASPALTLPPNGTAGLLVKVERDSYTGPIKLRIGNLPGGVTCKRDAVIPAEESSVRIDFQTDGTAAEGSPMVEVVASAEGRTVDHGNFSLLVAKASPQRKRRPDLDGSFLRQPGTEQVYWVQNGYLRHVTEGETLGRVFGDKVTVMDSPMVAVIEIGRPVDSAAFLGKAPGRGEVYFVDYGHKCHILSSEIMHKYHFLGRIQDTEAILRMESTTEPLVPRAPPVDPITTSAPSKDIITSIGMKFVHLPKGTFYMGWDGVKKGKRTEITTDFEIAIHCVTQGQWKAVMGNNPCYFSRIGGGKDMLKSISDADLKQFPVEHVSWVEAQEFINRVNQSEHGRGWLYRLPTEAEWEYACRGAATSEQECSYHFYFDKRTNDLSSNQANFNGNMPSGVAPKGRYLGRTTKVGSYRPNRLGLYDMHGNVCQWCDDLYEPGGVGRVLRGGCWSDFGQLCQASVRNRDAPTHRSGYIGFRLARVPFRETENANSIGIQFVHLPKGTFFMGGGGGKVGKKTEIAADFEIAVHTVTQGQWQELMGNNPSHFSRTGAGADSVKGISDADLKQFPVENVSWNDVQEFVKKINEREPGKGWTYRLPTEAEWEYACRGGATTEAECRFDFYFDVPTNDLDSTQANFDGAHPGGNAAKGPFIGHPCKVGSYKPDRLGLHDMHGNVRQWCEARSDGKGRPSPAVKGGSWHGVAVNCRAAFRSGGAPNEHVDDRGFRLVRSVSQDKEMPPVTLSIAGVWQEGAAENQIRVTIVQDGEKFTADCFYQHKEAGKVHWRMTGTISQDGKIMGRLEHLMPKNYKRQVRTASLSADGNTITGRATFDGGGHDFVWTRVGAIAPFPEKR